MTFNTRKVCAISKICNDPKEIKGGIEEYVGETSMGFSSVSPIADEVLIKFTA
ncbi:hypothetical protein LTR17_018494 [Elasticomyces elasticus]|nr:hypothetical protein LTR17_018494 [Elasticomyces elasticus]